MSLKNPDINVKLVREITIILIIKVVLLLTIKHIWFDAPTIPQNFDNQVAEHIAGDNTSHIKETR
ncbi:cytochrome oxidase putative small subunit CydP [Acinetobacter sp. TUM15375]|uniref:cytochrome oxidase putative small subunit CydP n=1 Tax=Acinetobacter sp. TUM15375 TaxID=2609148 RepID=UPI001250A0CF|nr:cytochrome oxidase putative small subunit CydP [Acinetobacter sp. TUM15375]